MSLKIIPVILAGGSGTRLWPLSRSDRPKQFIRIAGGISLFQKTLERIRSLPNAADPLVVCNDAHRFITAEQMKDTGIDNGTIILEPVIRNTAPAITVAALHLKYMKISGQVLMLVLPTDHLIQETETFAHAIDSGRAAASVGKLVTFGIRPIYPATGYGYIKAANNHFDRDSFPVESFVEKPDRNTAETYAAANDWFWNSGIFLFTPNACLAEMERFSPAIVDHIKDALSSAVEDINFIRLKNDNYARCENISIDRAVMEHSDRICMVPMVAKWDDIGSWSSLWKVSKKDKYGNVTYGDVYLENVKDSYVHSEFRLVTALGVDSLILVETHDCLLVARKDHDQDIRRIVTNLKNAGRSEVEIHRKTVRPWGEFHFLGGGHHYQVKHITVNPGESTSTQKHFHRTEHWTVVRGTAEVTRGGETFMLSVNESTHIPLGEKHKLRNPGNVPLEIIEVQSGSYLGEDDIQRIDDEYGRN